MPITLKRRDNETNERLIRRFSRRIQTSGLLIRTKKRKYREKEKSANQTKREALHRLGLKIRDEYLRKIGALDEDTYGRGNKKSFRKSS